MTTRRDTERLRKTKVIILRGPREGRLSTSFEAAWENTRWSGGRHREQGKCLGRGLYRGFKGKARQGRVNCLGMACVNNVSGLWAIVVVFSCLAPSPGMVKAKDYFLKLCILYNFLYIYI